MRKIVILALLTLPFLFLLNTPIGDTSRSSQYLRSFPTPEKQLLPDPPTTLNKNTIMAKAMSVAVPFVKNVGQFDGRVNYAADLFAGRFFLTNNELVYSLVKCEAKKDVKPDHNRQKVEPEKIVPGKGLAIREYFVDQKGARMVLKSVGEHQAATKVSYFKGNDARKWWSNIPSYQSVSLGEVYPGIEVKLKASGKNVEKIFYVSPAGDVADLKIGVSGLTGIKIGNDGKLILKNSLGDLAMRAPVAWQEIDGERHDVKVGYRLPGKNLYGFSVCDGYDAQYPLIIDPELDTLTASTCLGGRNYDTCNSIALDRWGNVYVTGHTESPDFPTTSGVYTSSNNSFQDIFISKLNGDLTVLLASTFLGGSSNESSSSLVLDNSGNIYVTGYTFSPNFPTTVGAFDQIIAASSASEGDAFVSILDGNLNILLASTFLGGDHDDTAYSLALDCSGNVFVSGCTHSFNFPTTFGAFEQTFHGASKSYRDAFVARLNNELTALEASTFLGGNDSENSASLSLDMAGNVFVAGSTNSADFPTTSGAYDATRSGFRNVYVAKLNGWLSDLLAATYLGGGSDDRFNSLGLDSAGSVYVSGCTDSKDFPTTPGAYAQKYICCWDAFVSKLDCNLTVLQASTFLGGSGLEMECFLALDGAENICLLGTTNSNDFPTTAGAYDRTYYNGVKTNSYDCRDLFIAKINKDLSVLEGSTYLGGGGYAGEFANSIAVNGAGDVFVAGRTNSDDFPLLAGSYAGFMGYYDGFIARLAGGLSRMTVRAPDGGESWDVGTAVDIEWETSSAAITMVKIEVSIDQGVHWHDVIASAPNTGIFNWIIPDIPSLQCLIQISDIADATSSDTSNTSFHILMPLDLQAELLMARAVIIQRPYAKIAFRAGNPAVEVERYKLLRRKGISYAGFELIRSISPSELQNGQFQMLDQYLEKGLRYTYLVEAYNAAGKMVGHSAEKTIR